MFNFRISAQDRHTYFVQFSALIHHGIPLHLALKHLGDITTNTILKKETQKMQHAMLNGVPFEVVVQQHPKIFDEVIVGTLRSGAQAGQLPKALEQLVDYTSQRDRAKRIFDQLKIYPIILTVSMIVFLGFLITWFVPKMKDVYAVLKIDIENTSFLFQESNTFIIVFMLFVLLLFSPFIIPLISLLDRSTRIHLHRIMLNFELIRFISIERFALTLSLQLANQVEILNALRISAQASANLHIQQQIEYAIAHITYGDTLHQALSRLQLFHGFTLDMIRSSEETGDYAEALNSAADFLKRVINHKIAVYSERAKYIIILFFGGMILWIMVSAFAPMFDKLSTALSTGF
ncbi:type II secretion system F family protein [Magnetococcales bacterium HHB-1]